MLANCDNVLVQQQLTDVSPEGAAETGRWRNPTDHAELAARDVEFCRERKLGRFEFQTVQTAHFTTTSPQHVTACREFEAVLNYSCILVKRCPSMLLR